MEKQKRKPRRHNHEGTRIQKRDDGRYMTRVMYGYTDDGKPNYQYFYGKTIPEVQKAKKEYEEKVDKRLDTSKSYTLSEFADIWMKRHKKNIEDSTAEGYQYTLRMIKDYFGNRGLADINTMEVEDFLYKLREDGVADSSVSKCRGMLTQIYKRAMAYRLVDYNPSILAEKMTPNKPAEKKVPFTPEECNRLFDELPQDKMGWTIRLMIATGLRPQEVMGLSPAHITEDGAHILVHQAMKRKKGTTEIGKTKNESSFREIPVPQIARKAALELRKTDAPLIWESPRRKGKPCNPSHFNDKFKECLSTIKGMSILTPHCCRATYVSIMQSVGVQLETVSHLVGHTTTRITESRYLNIYDEVRQDALDRFDKRFGQIEQNSTVVKTVVS